MKSGELAQLSVDSLTLEGEGVGQTGDRSVSCRGLFPGERGTVRITALSRHHPRAYARLVSLDETHAGRRGAPCPNHEAREGRCAGCALMELEEPTQRALKRDMLRDRFALDVPEVEAAPSQLGYRYSSKRVAFAVRGALTLGSYAHGSHDPAPMPGCLVDHPLLVAAFSAIEQAARELRIAPYDERRASGDLRYVWCKTNGRDVIATVVTAQQESRACELAQALAAPIAGVLHSVQGGRSNTLRGTPAVLLRGLSELRIDLLGRAVEVGALGFVQPNPRVAERAYAALLALDHVPERGLAYDLYAGAGLTTQHLRGSFAEVVPCEAHPESARALGVSAESVEQFLARVLAQVPACVPDLVIANPPRKGLGPEVCRQLLALSAPHLHVMSCGPEGLARDLGALAAHYEVDSLRAFDTLPQTPHVELVARLRLRAR